MSTSAAKQLESQADALRKLIFSVLYAGGGGHIPSCLSIVEILTVLYRKVLRVRPEAPDDPHRDRFILSKGHASVALYAILAETGFIDHDILWSYGKSGTTLGGHPDMHKIKGVEASTGALGHGLSFGAGMALAGRLDKQDYRVFVLMGDGECQEGSVWEAAMFASQRQLDNLTAIIDANGLQAMDRLDAIVGLEPLGEKWRSFGWEVREIDGHDLGALQRELSSVPWRPGRPNLLVARTIKGKGISFMENVPIWHYRMPNPEELRIALQDLQLESIPTDG